MDKALMVACALILSVGVGLLAAGQGIYWVSAIGLGLIFLAGSLIVTWRNRADL